ncbi:hypothetical protein BU24DRAFT_425055 [Aaosphaeria arxii CBS 175.79]|uniref:Calcineurin-like phosphoesterase domain-containing protein n=1 Tax=Aaosphaeria arxii CBS 175.79 TaxID=1450172 RepID=A0A6A5XMC3_9PLEO|nr:uncharacterized protein BU24DRAFT_425055 [Aaosphaeria arxii CBS 175.79]KAF2014056.1 hypothetical protein BU24DRAFT_425055 [Aaosphaeria arxii CBS 175.79]
MQLSRLLFLIALVLLPPCLLSTTWLYLYPQLHSCAFPTPNGDNNNNHNISRKQPHPHEAPFRLLALGDPQLEGDSSLPSPDEPLLPSLSDLFSASTFPDLKSALHSLLTADVPAAFHSQRKRLDLLGNDYYLAHIVRSLRRHTHPTHVAVLGDLLGSQWVSDEEFERRAGRYWGRVFKGMERVPEGYMWGDDRSKWESKREVLGADEKWEDRVINIAGNHDVGYAGDLDEDRVERFERAFGRVNWDLWLEYPAADEKISIYNDDAHDGQEEESRDDVPALRLVILNTMNIDVPALSDDLQRSTYDFLNHIITTSLPVESSSHSTVLLTHIPLHKESGTCVDAPLFTFFSGHPQGIKEQNMLSEHSSKTILEGIFGLSGNADGPNRGLGRKGVIINGHDHEGCDVIHYHSSLPWSPNAVDERNEDSAETYCETSPAGDAICYGNATSPQDNDSPPSWRAIRTPSLPPRLPLTSPPPNNDPIPSLREVTLRSMMGSFGGRAGFLSAWYDTESREWRLEIASCGLGVQHWWWGVHIADFVLVLVAVSAVMAWGVERVVGGGGAAVVDGKEKEEKGKG